MPKATYFKLSEAKQNQIIQAGMNGFSKASFNEVKISSIIKEAKIPRSSFYDYFDDKLDLFKYLIGIIGEAKKKYFEEVLDQNTDFFDYLSSILKAGAKFAASKPEYDAIGKRMYKDFELMKEIFGEAMQDIPNEYEAIIRKGIENHTIRADINIKFIAQVLSILSSQLIVENMDETHNLSEIIEESVEHMMDFIKQGIGHQS